jgi:hypothetical protein
VVCSWEVIAAKKIKDGSRIGLESKRLRRLRQVWLNDNYTRRVCGFKMTFTFAER